ncbi:glycoside hydrolase family 15 protein [Sphingomonas sabuli]|uniref:Glycoside hydrolase family 15 protein n=1 Tax=Sphingomonas sabuli TaxID=2764186 RepID=A0A7G9L033_9SPHN|nr:glycoside hydrolase family 15 protein [Sphingomonas sabuli]QNM81982.1 glycoside hydrolase family 15 protein [Sphingomonas sabuli]
MNTLDLWPIGNCQVSALVDAEAGFVWGCQPRVDGDPLFCSLLEPKRDPAPDRPAGEWRIALVDQVSAEPSYVRNTPILTTRLTDKRGGMVDVIDFCPRQERSGRMYRPVAFLRIVRPVAGSPRVRILLNPSRAGGAEDAPTTSGTNHIRFLLHPQPMRLTTDAPIGNLLDGEPFRLERTLNFFLGPDEPFVGNVEQEMARMLHQTKRHWQTWVRGLAIPLEWQEVVIRSAITLKLCQHEETGAIVAALTTSIPEHDGSQRNWDYRYCWIRDAYYTVQALNRLGALDVLEGYLTYLRNIIDAAEGGTIQPLYSVSGQSRLEESEAKGFAGYRGLGPVRFGNAAYTQIQHDAYGQIVLSSAQAFFDRRLLRMATREDFTTLESVGEQAVRAFDQPDAGLWEFRTKSSVHTYSAVMCWAACDRLAKIAATIGLPDRAEYWAATAARMRAAITEQTFLDGDQRFAATFGGDELDASLLQLADLQFVDPGDPRFGNTLDAVERELRKGEHMLRYASEDDFGRPQTAFNFCTFWLIESLHLTGRDEEARMLYAKMLERRTPAGLLSEDTDFRTGELWGNYPQTYSLVGLINCAVFLSRPWSAIR